MKRLVYLVLGTVLLFAVGAHVLWVGASKVAYRKSVDTLHVARNSFGWKVGQYGCLSVVDRDGDGNIDTVSQWPELAEEGLLGEETLKGGERVLSLVFPHDGLVYRAVVPMRECHEQRNRVVALAYSVAGVFLLVLVALVSKILAQTGRLDELHRRERDRLARELASARAIQLSSLQRAELFRIEHLDSSIAAVTYPAREVGGDLYGTFELPDGRVAFVVGDVSGKGVPAAMFMHIAKSCFELRLRTNASLVEAVAQSNAHLCENNRAEMFVTAWFGVFDPKTGIVEYVNAGHNRPYVLRASGQVERIDGKGGLFLGAFPKATYEVNRLRLNRGERLFVYTNGVTEARDAEKRLYGEARLVACLAKHPSDLCQAVRADVDAFVGGVERSDDQTMLTLAYHGRPEEIEQDFVADHDTLAEMLEFVRGVVRFQHPKQELRLLNAVDEVMANIISYSGSATVRIKVQNVPGRCAVIISDTGTPYDPLTHQDPNVHVNLQNRPIGGLGILMVKKLVNSITYSRSDGRNVLRLVQIDFNGKYRQIV